MLRKRLRRLGIGAGGIGRAIARRVLTGVRLRPSLALAGVWGLRVAAVARGHRRRLQVLLLLR